MIRALYVHIPFCERKCEYCDFTSIAGRSGEGAYVAALVRELQMLGAALPGVSLDTIFVGGGTPSLIEPERLVAVLAAVHDCFSVAPGAEITLEANPSSTSRVRATTWRGAGFNRVSIGVQSMEPDVLAFLGRVHDAQRATAAVSEVRDAGFESINCDLIYAVPGLDDARWRRTLEAVVTAEPSHVSCYELTVEEGTPLHTSVRRGLVTPVDAERACGQHEIAVDSLEAAGYAQYEVSNFARPGEQCRHNLVYWRNGYYVAAGVGAHGHLPTAAAAALGLQVEPGATAVRYRHGRGIAAYTAAVGAGIVPVRDTESVSVTSGEQERLMLGLRLHEGVALHGEGVWREALELASAGLLQLDDRVARATSRGEEVLNAVTLRLAMACEPAGTTGRNTAGHRSEEPQTGRSQTSCSRTLQSDHQPRSLHAQRRHA
jgi:oxygen-independent coproporphyrinogen-3 oxidase